jgi:hypothetical protein
VARSYSGGEPEEYDSNPGYRRDRRIRENAVSRRSGFRTFMLCVVGLLLIVGAINMVTISRHDGTETAADGKTGGPVASAP